MLSLLPYRKLETLENDILMCQMKIDIQIEMRQGKRCRGTFQGVVIPSEDELIPCKILTSPESVNAWIDNIIKLEINVWTVFREEMVKFISITKDYGKYFSNDLSGFDIPRTSLFLDSIIDMTETANLQVIFATTVKNLIRDDVKELNDVMEMIENLEKYFKLYVRKHHNFIVKCSRWMEFLTRNLLEIQNTL
ncbi:PREDICTED: uncharacterized protein LOC108568314 [Nicrophorus vespilloides]|uniref:Uncharacterized protein LOC108568314 n=1 Tax=Nicrophorus vespilloides TaxID=110193 RepID=A0ABM1NDA3_NICVS|nr:PREDICTED: uncharacterized protein LOC108568314 [Nicrophorus vespilloides]